MARSTRSKRKSQSKRRRVAVIGGLATGAAAAATAVWRKLRGGKSDDAPAEGDEA